MLLMSHFLIRLMYYHFRKIHQAYAEVCVYTSFKSFKKLVDFRKKKTLKFLNLARVSGPNSVYLVLFRADSIYLVT